MGRKPKHGNELTKKVSVSLTETAIQKLDEWASREGMEGRSELIAKIALGQIRPTPEMETLGK